MPDVVALTGGYSHLLQYLGYQFLNNDYYAETIEKCFEIQSNCIIPVTTTPCRLGDVHRRLALECSNLSSGSVVGWWWLCSVVELVFFNMGTQQNLMTRLGAPSGEICAHL